MLLSDARCTIGCYLLKTAIMHNRMYIFNSLLLFSVRSSVMYVSRVHRQVPHFGDKIFTPCAPARLVSTGFDFVTLEMLHTSWSKVLSRCDLLACVSGKGGITVTDLDFLVIGTVIQ